MSIQVTLLKEGWEVAVIDASSLAEARDVRAEWESGETVSDIVMKDRRRA